MFEVLILFGKEIEGTGIDLKTPTVYTGQRVRGVLRVPHDRRHHRPMFDSVQIQLRGQINSLITIEGLRWKVEKPLVRMSYVKDLRDFQQRASDETTIVLNETNFFFDIPEYITLPCQVRTESKDILQPLPPSIRIAKNSSKEWLVQNQSGQCDVTYHIQARFLLNGRWAAEWRREILVMPALEVPPPWEPENLKREYTLSATSQLGSLWKRKRAMTISALSFEPRPLVLQATTRKSLIPGTDLDFNFTTRTVLDSRIDVQYSTPQFTTCEIVITMQAMMFFQDHELDEVTALSEGQESQPAVLRTTTFQHETRKMGLGRWQIEKNMISDGTRIVEWGTSVSVKALMPNDAPRVPSFFSTLISRHYAFDVTIKFGTEHATRSQRPMKLRIPVQIVHAGLSKGWDCCPDEDFEDDLEVPAYFP